MSGGVPTAMGYWAWEDVDPSRRAFDPGPARSIADASIVLGADRSAIEEAVDRALLAEYGTWIAGWRWAASEPGCGGLVRAWCCADDSLLRDGEDRESSVARVVDAVKDWRAVLEQLAELFAVLRDENASIEQAATRLLTLVVDRTEAYDAWYATYANSAAIGGAVTKAMQAEPPIRDMLGEWLARRDEPLHHIGAEAERALVTVDAHRRWIDAVDEARDAPRAARMRAALAECRASARRGDRLTFERLAAWQAIVLGAADVAFRTTEAFAKGGRERYSVDSETKARFEAALDETNDLRQPAATRAAKAYLDVCFFHPFEDGNARAARLVLDHVLTRAGLALHAVDPVFVVSRAGDDPRGTWNLAHVIDHLAGKMGTMS